MATPTTKYQRRRPSCTCRQSDHVPTECPYPNGCSDCMCDMKSHNDGRSTFCETCEVWTVHPDEHAHVDGS